MDVIFQFRALMHSNNRASRTWKTIKHWGRGGVVVLGAVAEMMLL